MTAIILDTETTGLDEPQVIALARSGPLPGFEAIQGTAIEVQYFKPSKPITAGALATHHIIEEDLADKPPWPGTWAPPAGVEYLIGHGVDYDWQAIGSPHVARICTLALARWLWPDLDSHKLTALIYFLVKHADAREMVQNAHSAAHDVWLCAIVLQHILAARPGNTSWHDVWQLSEKARIPERLTFGKYGTGSDWAKANNDGRGILCSRVRQYDPGYWDWLMAKCDQVRDDPYLQKALRGQA